jgi:hypothetical protein
MRIGGTSRDRMMTLIPLAVGVFLAAILLGGPEDGLRMIESAASDAWSAIALMFRR